MTQTTGHEDYLNHLRDRIHAAYRQIAAPGQWVKLTDLRPYIGGHRQLVDEALRRLTRAGQASIVPESNQKTLTDADHKAALQMGNQAKHLIAIGERS